MELFEAIHSRASVRSYTSDPVTDSQIDKIMRAAMAAPSGKNCQPWRFIVVRDRDTLDTLARRLPYAGMLLTAQAAVVVCGEPSASLATAPQIWIQDCSAATQNILLAAVGLGLGTCWTAAYPYPERASAVSRTLGIPEGVVPLNVIALGHPAGICPKDKYNSENIHFDKW